MVASDLRRNFVINGRKIDRVVPGVQSGRRIVTAYFTDGTCATYGARQAVTVGGYREPLPAGPVLTGGRRFGQTRKPRVSDGRWEGEFDGTRHDRLVANMAAYSM